MTEEDRKRALEAVNKLLANTSISVELCAAAETIRHALTQADEMQKRVDVLERSLQRMTEQYNTLGIAYDVLADRAEAADGLLDYLKEAAKRSSYVWSEGMGYTRNDWKNEGKIEIAKQAIEKFEGVTK